MCRRPSTSENPLAPDVEPLPRGRQALDVRGALRVSPTTSLKTGGGGAASCGLSTKADSNPDRPHTSFHGHAIEGLRVAIAHNDLPDYAGIGGMRPTGLELLRSLVGSWFRLTRERASDCPADPGMVPAMGDQAFRPTAKQKVEIGRWQNRMSL